MNMTDNIVSMAVPDRYEPVAVYYHDSDCVEYVREDAFVIYDRVDEFLTLIHDRTGHQLLGFKLKGFKYIFMEKLEPIYRLNESQFLTLVSAIEAICSIVGGNLFEDERRAAAYQAARKMAQDYRAELRHFNFEMAA